MKTPETSITLTVAEIRDLAWTAGFQLANAKIDADELETEYTIRTCPEGGLDDEGTVRHYRYVVFDAEYPEESGNGLGPEILL